MFALSTLGFVAQLYPLPVHMRIIAQKLAITFAKGPKGWIEGEAGNSFFRAKAELGLQAVCRCPISHLEAQFWRGGLTFMFDFQTRLSQLFTASASDQAPGINTALEGIHNSPYHLYFLFRNHLSSIGALHSLDNSTPGKIAQQMYNILFDSNCPKGSSFKRLEKSYSPRLNLPPFNIPRSAHHNAAKVLKWLSSRVPARVHNANVRLHLNGFHTGRRYQNREAICPFCQSSTSEDSIEHLLRCSVIQNLFPPSLKSGNPARIPAKMFFLLEGSQETKNWDGLHRIRYLYGP